MEIARHWRGQGERYLGGGGKLFGVRVDDESLHLKNNLKGREINLNHGSPDGSHLQDWAKGLVETMEEWGYNQETILVAAHEVSQQMNGSGAEFLEKVSELIVNGRQE